MKIFRLFSILTMALLAGCHGPAHADLIKQSSAYNRTVLMVSAGDHTTGATGLTLTVKIAKAGGSLATITPTVTEQGGGRYAISLVAGNTNTLGALDLQATATGADPSDTHDQVVAFDPADAAALGLSRVDAAISSRAATGAAMTLDMTQAVPMSNLTSVTTSTVGAALSAARAQGAGAWSIVGATLTLKNPDGSTFRTFTLSPVANPTSRN